MKSQTKYFKIKKQNILKLKKIKYFKKEKKKETDN